MGDLMAQRTVVFVVFAILLATGAGSRSAVAQADEPVVLTDSELGITLTLPAGYESYPELAKLQEDVRYAYLRQPEVDGEYGQLLTIEVLPGMIPKGGFRDEQIERLKTTLGSGTEHFVAQWEGFDLDAFSTPATVEGFDVITFHVQVPIKRRAIQLHFVGPRNKAGLMKTNFQRILFDLEAESSWSETGAVGLPPASSSYINTLFAIAIGAMIVGLIVLMVGSRWLPKWGVLVIAAVIYWLSWQVPNDPVRELKLLSGMLRMFGVIAGILGIVDLIRTRKPKVIVAPVEAKAAEGVVPPVVEKS
jgi:hypothetical protein